PLRCLPRTDRQTPFPPHRWSIRMTSLEERVISAVAGRIIRQLFDRGPGHCIQVANLPASVADNACRQVHEAVADSGDLARFVVSTSSRPWHATPTKIVELRNHVDEKDARLVIFIAAGDQLA